MGLDQLLQSSYLFSKQKAILPTISSSSTTHAQLKRHLSWSAAYYRWLQFLLAILHFLRIFRILAFFCHFGELLVFKACREFNFCRDFCKKSGLAKNLAIYKNPQFCNSLKFWSFISKSYEMTVVSLPQCFQIQSLQRWFISCYLSTWDEVVSHAKVGYLYPTRDCSWYLRALLELSWVP